jgi:hypothetical protein
MTVAGILRCGDSAIFAQMWAAIEHNTRQVQKLLAAQQISIRIISEYGTIAFADESRRLSEALFRKSFFAKRQS